MIEEVDRLRSLGFKVSILSDQTDWLDEIDRRTNFSRHFDRVINSFHNKKSKRQVSLFHDAAAECVIKPEEIVFVDDNVGNLKRAASQGWNTVHFRDMDNYRREMANFVPHYDSSTS